MIEVIKHNDLSDAEAAVYDRQIRLWGLDSQKRLRHASVLLVTMNGFSGEIAKNIILAGVKSVTFLDHRNSVQEDIHTQFLIDSDQIGKNKAVTWLKKAHKLNPLVNIKADTDNVDDKEDSFFGEFDIVCVTGCTITQMKRINRICRDYDVKFFAGDVWGSFGYTFADLNTHELEEDLYGQVSPSCAIVGGIMAQEIIKTIAQNGRPHNNLFVFNPVTMIGQVLKLH
ncbi:unnamed protein product [Trichogramma brassicae]|uniref:SUMO-activating enzyme subunit 1 n=1 Tax=Trichogramma brassicae TaxID=86971 RepID=A0A6H5I020_9HYME|nr:unnamed protein product [Trichogramma brassicae]